MRNIIFNRALTGTHTHTAKIALPLNFNECAKGFQIGDIPPYFHNLIGNTGLVHAQTFRKKLY